MKKLKLLTILFIIVPVLSYSQGLVKVSGLVKDTKGELLVGVSVVVKNSHGVGVATGIDGDYSIMVNPNDSLVFSYIGYKSKTFGVGNKDKELNVVLEPKSDNLDEVTVVGYGTQRKISVIGAITTIAPKELNRGAVTSITNALAGRVPGLIGVQLSGEPGQDVSEFWIRGISTFGANASALILIDGIERSSINDVAPEDIESFSVLKDATATAVYGARGANGVILINTKKGKEGKLNISANIKTMIETLPRLPEYLHAYEYAKLANEASVVRGGDIIYPEKELNIIKSHMDPDLYPDVDWQKELLKKSTWGLQANVNFSGGGKFARYYVSGFYRTNDAAYKESGMERYHTNVRRRQYSFRSNFNLSVTKTTNFDLQLAIGMVDLNRPGIGTTDQIWDAQANLNPLTVPIQYSNGLLPAYGKDDLASPSVLLNQTGYQSSHDNTMEATIILNQDFNFITKGLKAQAKLSFDNYGSHVTNRHKMPDMYKAIGRNWNTGKLIMDKRVTASPISFSASSSNTRSVYLETQLNWDRTFLDKHRISAMLLYNQSSKVSTSQSGEIGSIPYRDQGLAGRFMYSFNDIYFGEFNFGYNGNENFPKNRRFGFFPSIAVGWMLSNYQYVKDRIPFLNLLKLRYSYGEVGNGDISDKRFPFLSYVDWSEGYKFGDRGEAGGSGYTEIEMGSRNLKWETANKMNFGIDVEVFKDFSFTIDVYKDVRSGIYMRRNTLPDIAGVSIKPYGNVGKMKSWGTDGNFAYHHQFGEFWFEVRGNFTHTNDKILEYDEPIRKYSYLQMKGSSSKATRGLVALGLFKDEEEIKNSPGQFNDKLYPGDIKYKDINGDDRVDYDDYVQIGNSWIPHLQYGLAATAEWRGIDFNIFFRGASKVDFFYDGNYFPFDNKEIGNVLSIVNNPKNRWIPKEYSGDPSTENPNAKFPRLSYGRCDNNWHNSTYNLADASYLRLKTVEIGYTLSKKISQKLRLEHLRFSVIGDNLHVWDKVKLWDPEQASANGATYPLTRSFTFTLSARF